MDAPSTDRRKRTQLPFVLFVIGSGLLDIAMIGILLNGWAGMAFIQWSIFFVQASLMGQILFAILLGGLLGKYWHPRISRLDLQGSEVTDQTMKFLSNITGLMQVNVADTEITDAALPYLSKCMVLNLSKTRITFDGLHSDSFQNAQTIQVALGQFSVEEVRELKRKLPVVVGKMDELQW